MQTLTISWHDFNIGEDGFNVYRSGNPMDINNMPEPIAALPSNTCSYDDNNVVFGETYYYRIGVTRGSEEVLSDEQILVAGNTHIYGGSSDKILNKFSFPDGRLLASKRFIDDDSNDRVYIVNVDSKGRIYYLYWDRTLYDEQLKVSTDGSFGESITLNNDQNVISSRHFSEDIHGNIYVYGRGNGILDKYTSDLNLEWSTTIGKPYRELSYMYVSDDGTVYTVMENEMYISYNDNNFRRVAPTKEINSSYTASIRYPDKILYHGGSLYVAGDYFLKIDLDNGNAVIDWYVFSNYFYTNDVFVDFDVNDSNVVAVSENYIVSYNKDTGEQMWYKNNTIYFLKVAFIGKFTYAIDNDLRIKKYDENGDIVKEKSLISTAQGSKIEFFKDSLGNLYINDGFHIYSLDGNTLDVNIVINDSNGSLSASYTVKTTKK